MSDDRYYYSIYIRVCVIYTLYNAHQKITMAIGFTICNLIQILLLSLIYVA